MTLMLSTSAFAIFLNISGVELQKMISASEMTIVNTLNKLIIIIIGVIMYKESISFLQCLGILMSFTGCLIFHTKYFLTSNTSNKTNMQEEETKTLVNIENNL
tara:strand:- start:2755 stop:3063 length:309 start_codon:yes stop_codon:yes gene_type:complete